MAVTIKDIAKKAGVSYSTVSRALNDQNADKSDKKKRILRIAKEMGYVPNQAAINLKMSRSYVIGLYFSTISKMTSPFVLHDVLTGVYSVVGSRYNVVVKGIDMHEPGTLNPTYYDGIIVLSQRNEDLAFMERVAGRGEGYGLPAGKRPQKPRCDRGRPAPGFHQAAPQGMEGRSRGPRPRSGAHPGGVRKLPFYKRISGGQEAA